MYTILMQTLSSMHYSIHPCRSTRRIYQQFLHHVAEMAQRRLARARAGKKKKHKKLEGEKKAYKYITLWKADREEQQ